MSEEEYEVGMCRRLARPPISDARKKERARQRLQAQLSESYSAGMRPITDIPAQVTLADTLWVCPRCTIQQSSRGNVQCELCRCNPFTSLRLSLIHI